MKSISTAFNNALKAAHVRPVFFVQFDFDVVQRYCSAGADIAWNGQTWNGKGLLAWMEPIRETSSLESIPLRIGVSGVPESLIALALEGGYRNRDVKVWLGLLDNDYQVIASPDVTHAGKIDVPRITKRRVDPTDPHSPVIREVSITVYDVLVDAHRTNGRRYTDADQRRFYPNDTAGRFMSSMADSALVWKYRE